MYAQLPELNPSGGSVAKFFVMQLAGVLLGQTIMFLIAYYEESFQQLQILRDD